MDVEYHPPTKNERGLFTFEEPLRHIWSESVRVSSLDDYLARQNRILDVTRRAVDYLRHRELPARVEGNVKVTFRLCDANKYAFGLGRVGVLGFPDFSIQTNYGHSNFYLWPKGEGGEVEVHGRGLAEEVVRALQGDFERAFNVPDSELQTTGGHVGVMSLTARLILPKPRF